MNKVARIILAVIYIAIIMILMLVNIQLGEIGKAVGMAIVTAVTVAIQTHIFNNWK